MSFKILFLVFLSFFYFANAHADVLENGCIFNEGPAINGQATYQVISNDNSGESHSLLWLKNAEVGLFINAGAVDQNGHIIPPNEPISPASQPEATDICSRQQLSLPTLEEFESLRNCFAPILDPSEDNFFTFFSAQELPNYEAKFPNDHPGGFGLRFWSSTDATGKFPTEGDNPVAYLFGSDGQYGSAVRVGEVEQTLSVRCVKRTN